MNPASSLRNAAPFLIPIAGHVGEANKEASSEDPQKIQEVEKKGTASVAHGSDILAPQLNLAASSLSEHTITQVPSLSERTLQVVEGTNEIASHFLDFLTRLNEAKKTIACLRAINITGLAPEAVALWQHNRAGNFSERFLVLNKTFLPLPIPSADGQGEMSYVVPSMMPSNMTIYERGEAGNLLEKKTSDEKPTAEENRKMRSLITEAVKVYCGDALKAKPLLAALNEPKQGTLDDPIKIEDLGEGIEQIEVFIDQEKAQIKIGKSGAMSLSAAEQLAGHSFAAIPASFSSSFEEAYEALAAPEKALLQVFYHSAEVVARTSAIVAGGASGAALGAVAVGAAGAVAGALGGVLSAVTVPYTWNAIAVAVGTIGSFYGGFFGGEDLSRAIRLRHGGEDDHGNEENSVHSEDAWPAVTAAAFGGYTGFAGATAALHPAVPASTNYLSYARGLVENTAHGVLRGAHAGAAASVVPAFFFGALGGIGAAYKAYHYFAPWNAVKKIEEAFSSLRGEKAELGLKLMKEAQIIDAKALEALATFFHNLPQPLFNNTFIENAKTSSTIVSTNSEKMNEESFDGTSDHVKNFGDVQSILKKGIEQRIVERGKLITKLSEKIRAVKKQKAEILRSRVRRLSHF